MFLFFCAFITNKYLKLSIWKPKPFKTKQPPKKQVNKETPFHLSPPKIHLAEKTFKIRRQHNKITQNETNTPPRISASN
jgi:hypothetical protein